MKDTFSSLGQMFDRNQTDVTKAQGQLSNLRDAV